VTRELKLALIVGFSLLLVVTVLISDHLSKAQNSRLSSEIAENPALVKTQPPRERLVAEPPVTPTTDGTRLAMNEQDAPLIPSPGPAPSPVVDEPVMIHQGKDRNEGALSKAIEGDNDLIVPGRGPAKAVPMAGVKTVATGMEDLVNKVAGATGAPQTVPPVPTQPDNQTTKGSSGPDQLPAPKPESVTTKAEASGKVHQVAPGENLSKIARRYYGDSKHWKKIADANPKIVGKNGEVRVGVKITIPELTPAKSEPSPSTPKSMLGAPDRAIAAKEPAKTEPKKELPRTTLKSAETKVAKADRPVVKEPVGKPEAKKASGSYTVRSGDTLSGIAQRELGSVSRVKDIVELNKDSLGKDRAGVRVGQVLRLPKA
jgi:nucleoid-associated protein YgaU